LVAPAGHQVAVESAVAQQVNLAEMAKTALGVVVVEHQVMQIQSDAAAAEQLY
jgi:hypothetical protein